MDTKTSLENYMDFLHSTDLVKFVDCEAEDTRGGYFSDCIVLNADKAVDTEGLVLYKSFPICEGAVNTQPAKSVYNVIWTGRIERLEGSYNPDVLKQARCANVTADSIYARAIYVGRALEFYECEISILCIKKAIIHEYLDFKYSHVKHLYILETTLGETVAISDSRLGGLTVPATTPKLKAQILDSKLSDADVRSPLPDLYISSSALNNVRIAPCLDRDYGAATIHIEECKGISKLHISAPADHEIVLKASDLYSSSLEATKATYESSVTEIHDCHLNNCTFKYLNLDSRHLRNSEFHASHFENTNLYGQEIENFTDCTFRNTIVSCEKLAKLPGTIHFTPSARIVNVLVYCLHLGVRNPDIQDMHVEGSELFACEFHSSFSNSNFVNCTFESCVFSGISITDCHFKDCTFVNCKFYDVSTRDSTFHGCKIEKSEVYVRDPLSSPLLWHTKLMGVELYVDPFFDRKKLPEGVYPQAMECRECDGPVSFSKYVLDVSSICWNCEDDENDDSYDDDDDSWYD